MLGNLTASRIANAKTCIPVIYGSWVQLSPTDDPKCFTTDQSILIISDMSPKIIAEWHSDVNGVDVAEKSETSGAIGISVECVEEETTLSLCKTRHKVIFTISNDGDHTDNFYFLVGRPSFDYSSDSIYYKDRRYYTNIPDYSIPLTTSYEVNVQGKVLEQSVTMFNVALPIGNEYTISWEDNDNVVKYGTPVLGELLKGKSNAKEGSIKYNDGPQVVYPDFDSAPNTQGDHSTGAKFKLTAKKNQYRQFFGYLRNGNRIVTKWNLGGPGGIPIYGWIIIGVVIALIVIGTIIGIIVACCCCCGCCRKRKYVSSSSSA